MNNLNLLIKKDFKLDMNKTFKENMNEYMEYAIKDYAPLNIIEQDILVLFIEYSNNIIETLKGDK